MSASRKFGNLIWTNHALERLDERRFSQSLASSAFSHPDRVIKGKILGSYEYQKQYQNSKITLIAKKNDQGEGLVLSTWIDPPLPGTRNEKKKKYWEEYRRAGFWGKWWVMFKQSLGL